VEAEELNANPCEIKLDWPTPTNYRFSGTTHWFQKVSNQKQI